MVFNYMIKKNFSLWEFFKTDQGLFYECEQLANFSVVLRNIILHEDDVNYSLSYVARNILDVADFLQDFRNSWNVPILINSGLRSAALNKKVGGVENSKHLIGKAVDFTFNGYSTFKKPIKGFGTPYAVSCQINQLEQAKESGKLTELIFHDNYIHIAL